MGSVGEIINKAEYPNHVWSYDFVEDRTERGGKLIILAIIDEYTRGCLAIRVASSIPASAVVGVLEWLFLTLGNRIQATLFTPGSFKFVSSVAPGVDVNYRILV